jgi:hypothetical protein
MNPVPHNNTGSRGLLAYRAESCLLSTEFEPVAFEAAGTDSLVRGANSRDRPPTPGRASTSAVLGVDRAHRSFAA